MVFYAYENAVVAVAEAEGIPWEKIHPKKAALARTFVTRGTLKTDVSELLSKLNTLRKDVSYGDPGEELSEVDLEDLVSDLETYLEEVSLVVEASEEE